MTLKVVHKTFKNNTFLTIVIFDSFNMFHVLGRRVGRSPLNSHPATSRDDVCSEAGVNKRSVEMFRRYVDVNRLTDA